MQVVMTETIPKEKMSFKKNTYELLIFEPITYIDSGPKKREEIINIKASKDIFL